MLRRRNQSKLATAIFAALLLLMVVATAEADPQSTTDSTYVNALMLAEKGAYRDAAGLIREATRADKTNLNAWKMRIWLSTLRR